jgi:hypothetical protein
MTVKVSKLIRQVVCVRNNVEVVLTELFLHLHDVGTKSVFAGQLETVGEMVDLLILVHVVINIGLKALTAPQDIPVVRLSLHEAVGLQHRPEQLGLTLDKLEEHLHLALMAAQDSPFLEVDCGGAIVSH